MSDALLGRTANWGGRVDATSTARPVRLCPGVKVKSAGPDEGDRALNVEGSAPCRSMDARDWRTTRSGWCVEDGVGRALKDDDPVEDVRSLMPRPTTPGGNDATSASVGVATDASVSGEVKSRS